MSEREPRSLPELENARTRLNRALAKVDDVYQIIGTPTFDRGLDLTKLSGEDYIHAAVRVGTVKKRLTENARPTLQEQLEGVESRIENFARIQQLEREVATIQQLVRDNQLSPAVLENAQQILANLRQGLVARKPEPEVKAPTEAPKPEEARREALVLPDNQSPPPLSPMEARFLECLLPRSQQNPISSPALVQILWEGKVSIEAGRKRLHTLTTRLRGKLAEVGWEIANLVPVAESLRGKEGLYYLAPVEKEIPASVESALLPQLVFTRENIVELEGRRIRLAERQLRVLQVLARNIGQQVLSRQLSQEALGNPNPAKANLRNVISRLQYKIKPQTGEPFLVSKGAAHLSWNMLQGIEVVWPKPEPGEAEKPKKEFPPKVPESRLSALDIFINNPQVTVEEIIRTLGPSKRDRRLTRPQALWALKRTANILYVRERKGIATQEESELWRKIKVGTSRAVDIEALRTFRTRLEVWFKQFKTVQPAEITQVREAEEIEVEPLADEEAVVLASILFLRDDFIAKYGLERLPVEVVQKLVKRVQSPLELTSSQLNEFRVRALQKVKEIVRSEKLDQIYDCQNPDVQELLLYFMLIDTEPTFNLLEELLTSPIEIFWREQAGEIIKLWRGLRVSPTTSSVTVPEPAIATEPGPSKEESRRGIQPEVREERPAATVQGQVVSIEPPPKKLSSVERRDPEVRQKIALLLDEIAEAGISTLINSSQLTRSFPRLKSHILEPLIGKAEISPKLDRNGFPVYSVDEITILLYLKDWGNNLTPRLVKDLRRIIREELAKRGNELPYTLGV